MEREHFRGEAMSGTSEPEGPRWRSGPFVYGAVILSLPLAFAIIWAMPAVAPSVLKGNFSGWKVICGAVWGAIVIASPLAAVAFRRRYQYSEQWRRPRRLSITFAGIAYAVAVLSYVGIALAVTRPGF